MSHLRRPRPRSAARSPADRERAIVEASRAVDQAYTRPRESRRIAERIARTSSDPESLVIAGRAAGMAATALGELAAADQHLRSALRRALRNDLTTRAAEVRLSLGWMLTLAGTPAAALIESDRAAAVLHGVAGARARMLRGLICNELGRYDEASRAYGAALVVLRRAGGDPLLEADIRTNRSINEVALRRWGAADRDLTLAEAGYRATGHPGRIAMVRHNQALALSVHGDLPGALAAFDDAERRYRAADRPLGLLPIERAQALLAVFLVPEARRAAQQAAADYDRSGNGIDAVDARLVLSRAALLGDDPTVARAAASTARRAAQRQHRPGWAALAGYLMVRADWQAGTADAGTLRLARACAPALAETGWATAALDLQLIRARIEIGLGRPAAARRLLDAAASARRRGPADLRARAWHAEALLRLSLGRTSGALSALRAGLRVLDDFRAGLGAVELRAFAAGHGADLAATGLQVALRAGAADAVLQWAERWRAGALRMPPARPPRDRVLADALAGLRQVEGALDGAGRSEASSLLRRQADLELVVRDRTRHVRGAAAPAAALRPRALADALGDSVLVEYVEEGGQVWAVVVGGGRRSELVVLGSRDLVEAELDALRYGLRRCAYQRGSAEVRSAAWDLVRTRAAKLDQLLLGPVRHRLDDRDLVVVPTRGLHALPWSALPSCRRRAVSVVPSAALWLRAQNGRVAAGRHTVLVSGPGLPGGRREVAELARRAPKALRFTGNRARVGDVLAAMDGAGLVHIAAHGTFRADNPLFSALHLADGSLTGYDLQGLRRPPGLVVLSACESGLPAVHPGDEVLGLGASFLSAGTRCVVATVSPVPDEASRPLMLSFHRRLAAGHGPADALRRARSTVAGQGDDAADVAAAGFVCIGAG